MKEKAKKPIMDPTFAESFYTTSVPPEHSGINYNFTKTDKNSIDGTNTYGKSYTYYKLGDSISPNIGGLNYTGCQYLLPCGICERTGKQCPKHGWEPSWQPTCTTWTNSDTANTKKFNKKDFDSYTTYTTADSLKGYKE